MAVSKALFPKTSEDCSDCMPPNEERKRFHSFRDFVPARNGVAGLRSHKRGNDRMALMGVKEKRPSEFSGAGLVVPLQC